MDKKVIHMRKSFLLQVILNSKISIRKFAILNLSAYNFCTFELCELSYEILIQQFYTVSQKKDATHHPTTIDNFNNSCQIPVIVGTNIALC